MLSTIIAGVDGSELARKAVVRAGDLAARYEARLVLIHVVTHEPLAGELRDLAVETGPGLAEADAPFDTDPTLRHALGERLLADCAGLARQQGAPRVETLLLEGDPATVIIARCQAEEADLVVLGAKGLGSLQGLLIGGVCQKVGQLSPCACLTVR